MPELEIWYVFINVSSLIENLRFIKRLAKFDQFKTWEDLIEVLDFPYLNRSIIKECILKTYNQKYDLSLYNWATKAISIFEIRYNLNIDWVAKRIKISFQAIQDITEHNLGTQQFYSSVKEIEIIMLSDSTQDKIAKSIDLLHRYFCSLKRINIKFSHPPGPLLHSNLLIV